MPVTVLNRYTFVNWSPVCVYAKFNRCPTLFLRIVSSTLDRASVKRATRYQSAGATARTFGVGQLAYTLSNKIHDIRHKTFSRHLNEHEKI